jgi:hypothetical protein
MMRHESGRDAQDLRGNEIVPGIIPAKAGISALHSIAGCRLPAVAGNKNRSKYLRRLHQIINPTGCSMKYRNAVSSSAPTTPSTTR